MKKIIIIIFILMISTFGIFNSSNILFSQVGTNQTFANSNNPYVNDVSSGLQSKIENLIQALTLKKETLGYDEWRSLINSLTEKLNSLQTKYSSNTAVVSLVNYLNYELQLLLDDELSGFMCDLFGECNENTSISTNTSINPTIDIQVNPSTDNASTDNASTDNSSTDNAITPQIISFTSDKMEIKKGESYSLSFETSGFNRYDGDFCHLSSAYSLRPNSLTTYTIGGERNLLFATGNIKLGTKINNNSSSLIITLECGPIRPNYYIDHPNSTSNPIDHTKSIKKNITIILNEIPRFDRVIKDSWTRTHECKELPFIGSINDSRKAACHDGENTSTTWLGDECTTADGKIGAMKMSTIYTCSGSIPTAKISGLRVNKAIINRGESTNFFYRLGPNAKNCKVYFEIDGQKYYRGSAWGGPSSSSTEIITVPDFEYPKFINDVVLSVKCGLDEESLTIRVIDPTRTSGSQVSETWLRTSNETITSGISSVSSTTYPGCNTPDIVVGNYTISACNVGTNIAGITSSSHGGYFQFGSNTTEIKTSKSEWMYDWISPGGPDAGSARNWGVTFDTRGTATYSNSSSQNQIKMQGPCANGYHVPTSKEWGTVTREIAKGTSAVNASSNRSSVLSDGVSVMNILKLPMAGQKDSTGVITSRTESNAYYWSSSPNVNKLFPDKSYGTNLFFSTNWGGIARHPNQRNKAFPVRCFKNSVTNNVNSGSSTTPTTPTSPTTTTTTPTSPTTTTTTQPLVSVLLSANKTQIVKGGRVDFNLETIIEGGSCNYSYSTNNNVTIGGSISTDIGQFSITFGSSETYQNDISIVKLYDCFGTYNGISFDDLNSNTMIINVTSTNRFPTTKVLDCEDRTTAAIRFKTYHKRCGARAGIDFWNNPDMSLAGFKDGIVAPENCGTTPVDQCNSETLCSRGYTYIENSNYCEKK